MRNTYRRSKTPVDMTLQGRHIASEQGREYILHDAEAAEAAERAAAEQAAKGSQELKQEEQDGSAALDISFELPSGALTGAFC
jgi:hypothetical protein